MPMTDMNNEVFFKHLDKLALFMKEQGFPEASQSITELLHDTAWTTSSELLGELRLLLVRLLQDYREKFPRFVDADIKNCIREIDKAFNA
ncbi:MAG: hypothetical protein EXS63_05745 [Candidatus Omnitrophica bacterium]|nr:hypothetical protein [Candidatus Omnitrophota bacterium]